MIDHNLQSKRIILELVRDALTRATDKDRREVAHLAATKAGHKAWEAANPEDGVGCPSMNPYNVNRAQEDQEQARKNLITMQQAHDFAVDTFICGEAE